MVLRVTVPILLLGITCTYVRQTYMRGYSHGEVLFVCLINHVIGSMLQHIKNPAGRDEFCWIC